MPKRRYLLGYDHKSSHLGTLQSGGYEAKRGTGGRSENADERERFHNAIDITYEPNKKPG
jgi:hypothetical protein